MSVAEAEKVALVEPLIPSELESNLRHNNTNCNSWYTKLSFTVLHVTVALLYLTILTTIASPWSKETQWRRKNGFYSKFRALFECEFN